MRRRNLLDVAPDSEGTGVPAISTLVVRAVAVLGAAATWLALLGFFFGNLAGAAGVVALLFEFGALIRLRAGRPVALGAGGGYVGRERPIVLAKVDQGVLEESTLRGWLKSGLKRPDDKALFGL